MVQVLLLIACLGPGGVGDAVTGPDKQMSEFAKVLVRLDREKQGAAAVEGLVRAGTDLIRAARAPSLDDELRFIGLVAEKSRFPEDAKRLERLLDLLLGKAGRDDEMHARILVHTATIYGNCLGNSKKEQELLLQAEQLQEQLQIRHAKQQVDVWLRLGDSHLQHRKKALPYYAKVLAFPLYDKPYLWCSEFKEFTEPYINAARRAVQLNDEIQIPGLNFHPLAYPSIARFIPDKAKLLGELSLPGIAEAKARRELWFELTAHDERLSRELREHVEAVWKYLQTHNP